MMGKSHIVFGVGAYLLTGEALTDALINPYSFTEWLLLTPLALIGSLLPDLDHPHSIIKKNILFRFLSFPLTLFGHRTWSHSLLILLCMGSAYFYIPDNFKLALMAFLIGYASHIIGDWMTPSGIPLLYPIKTKFRSPLVFKTGSFIELPFALLPLIIFFTIIFLNSEGQFPHL